MVLPADVAPNVTRATSVNPRGTTSTHPDAGGGVTAALASGPAGAV